MIDEDTLRAVLDAGERRRAERRRFLRMAGGATVAAGGLALLSACGDDNDDDDDGGTVTPTPSPTASPTGASADADVLNFALNLEYLEANYYLSAAFGQPLNPQQQLGVGTLGAVTGGRQVQFQDPTVASYAREIAVDEAAHVAFLRQQLGSAAVAQPAINIAGDANGAFTAAARSAGIIPATGTFDPYANDNNWLLGGMLLSDVGVTAYKGAAALLTSKVILEASAGILAVEAYHSGLLRTLLYRRGLQEPVLHAATESISNARDLLDGPQDLDQGVTGTNPGVLDTAVSNIAPTDANGITFGRTAQQVLNIAYLTRAAATSGGFFPQGVNGNIRTSANNA